MPVVRFTATRSLVAGVNLNDTVTYDLPVRYGGMTRGRAPTKSVHVSMAGIREAYYERAEETYAISSKPLTAAQADDLVMFLDSVEASEPFEFAPSNSSTDSPIPWEDAYLDSQGYSEPREAALDTMVSYGFTIAVPQ